MKSKTPKTFITLFLFFISAPPLLMLILPPEKVSVEENRALKEAPPLTLLFQSPQSYVTQFGDYFSDHFPFKNRLAKFNTYVKYKYFQDLPPRVILGAEGWLFYSNPDDGDPIGDYKNIRPLSRDEINCWDFYLREAERLSKAQGAGFLFVLAPNKETVYSEFMPKNIRKVGKVSQREQLLLYLSPEAHLVYLDLTPELLESKKTQQIYFKSDTHWNFAGANRAQQLIVERFKKSSETLQPKLYEADPSREETHFAGDLAKMIQMENKFYDIYQKPKDASPASASAPRLLIFGDSFADVLMYFLPNSFSKIEVIKHRPHLWELRDAIALHKPDVVLMERVERFIDQIPTCSEN